MCEIRKNNNEYKSDHIKNSLTKLVNISKVILNDNNKYEIAMNRSIESILKKYYISPCHNNYSEYSRVIANNNVIKTIKALVLLLLFYESSYYDNNNNIDSEISH